MRIGSNERGMSRFSNPKEPVYLRIVSQMQRCLLFKASRMKELERLLSNLVTLPNIYVDVQDERKRSALYCAASSPNEAAVTVLIMRGNANVLHKDIEGQTPLHSVIRKAAEVNPTDEEARKPFKEIIIRLMEFSEDIFVVDKELRTAWWYGKGLPWIEGLKDNRDMFLGPSASATVQLLEPLTVPLKDTPQIKACESIRGDLVEFYTVTGNNRILEKRNSERSYICDMIYNLGPKKILDLSRPKIKDEVFQCRWLHVPANVVGFTFAPWLDFF
jgi:hypothetical protein